MLRLERDKRICYREVELKFGEQTQLVTRNIELYYVPDTSEDELTAAIEKAQRTFQGMIRRKELKEKVWMEPPLAHLERDYARL